MRRVACENPDQLVYLQGGGCVLVIGAVFAAAGAFFLLAGLSGNIDAGSSTLQAALCLAAGAFILFGVAVAVSRSGMTFDRKRRTLSRWWGVWRPWGGSVPAGGVPANVRILSQPRLEHLTDGATVSIGRTVQKVPGKDQEQVVFPVGLDNPALALITYTDELEARRLAEEVACFLGIGLVDLSSGMEVRRDAEALMQALSQRSKHLALPAALPLAPEGARLGAVVDYERLTFTAPREPFDPFLLGFLVAPVLCSAGIYFALYYGRPLAELADQRGSIYWSMALILGLPLVAGLVGFLSSIYWGGRLEITEARVRCRGRLFGSASVPLTELTEIRIGKRQALWRVSFAGFSVRSAVDAEVLELQLVGARRILRFARGMTRAELEWARDVIQSVIQ
jgi:hypothetical protein